MARIENIQQRLENWALWSARGAGGGLGYASVSVLASDTWSRGRYNGMTIPVMDIEAEETDQAVKALRLSRSHLFVTLEMVYIKGIGVREAARRMRRAESTIHAQLAEADRLIQSWLTEHADDKRRRQEALVCRIAPGVSDETD